MLEKIGLPPKPSLRGNNWVIDASHCQGCSSQFTFINRKHHCRRCGGIFCNSCSQQRMVLRGQGDSPVRICEPCKRLEEAARFEMRYGHKNRSTRGSSRDASKSEEDGLNQLLGKESSSDFSSKDEDTEHQAEMGPSATPEELRQQAMEEKKNHRTLKASGKPEEALRAFKRSKELERQAAALEISLRKNRKRASSSSSYSNISEIRQEGETSGRKNKLSSQITKEKDDLSSELRELGWSDMDLRTAERKPATMSLEGELCALLGEVSEKKTHGTDKSLVIAHKKKAVELKREGKLAEAKEELKKAKIIERQIEEQELLGGDDESDDELSSLMRGLDADKFDDLSTRHDVVNLVGIGDDIVGNFEVTDEDLYDPEIAAALESMGWTEDATESEIQSLKKEAKNVGNIKADTCVQENVMHNIERKDGKSKSVIQRELLGIKKKALSLRREGKLDEAEEELKRGKILEKQLEDIDNPPKFVAEDLSVADIDAGDEEVTDGDLHDPTYLSLLENLGWQEDAKANNESSQVKNSISHLGESRVNQTLSGITKRSKGEIQRELLGLKRKALALRRQGKNEEADDVLKAAKILEDQLAEIEESMSKEHQPIDSTRQFSPLDSQKKPTEDMESKVTLTPDKPEEVTQLDDKLNISEANTAHETNSLRHDILARKRKAVALKREGKLAEAKEELRQAKLLQKSLEEESSAVLAGSNTDHVGQKEVSPNKIADISQVGQKEVSLKSVPKPLSGRDRFKLQQESLGHKRQAFKLRREGKMEEANAEFELAKAIESQLEEASSSSNPTAGAGEDVGVEDFLDPQLFSALKAIGMADTSTVSQSPERLETKKPTATIALERSEPKQSEAGESSDERKHLEEQIKAEKVKAVNLKRSGKQAEALDALRRAKMFEKKLNALAS